MYFAACAFNLSCAGDVVVEPATLGATEAPPLTDAGPRAVLHGLRERGVPLSARGGCDPAPLPLEPLPLPLFPAPLPLPLLLPLAL